ncbi:MAG TPA: hypothetical protein VJ863_03740 [Sphaerochaeta sp.]|nr:hypothetical protein [Sphaerochaeta sp.]
MKSDLPIKKGETLLETIVSAIFSILLFVLYLKPNLLAIYQKGVEPIPMLVSSSAKGLLFGLLLFSLVAFLVSLVRLIRKEWSMPLVWISCLSDLAGAAYFAFFMTRWDALDNEFLRFFRNDLATWALIAKAAALCFLLLTLISIADDLNKTYKHKKRA